ncbi:MAG TPA: hypothetical protein VF869_06885 [Jatrophihabitantaceae bacterium]
MSLPGGSHGRADRVRAARGGPQADGARRVARWGIATALMVAGAAAVAGGYSDRYDTIHGMAYVATIYSMPVLVFGLSVTSLAWRVVTSRRARVDS